MDTFLKILGSISAIIGIIFLVGFFNAFFVALTWNYIMPKIFVGIIKLTYWDAYVLSVLTSFLFKGYTTTSSSTTE